MPHFFIDTDDGDLFIEDDVGYDVRDAQTARQLALAALPDMARTKLPDGDRRTFAASVRDSSGKAIYVVTLDLVGKWMAPP